MNKEYIEREATIREFETDNSVFRYGAEDCSAIISRLKTIPKVDVTSIVHGRWIDTDTFDSHCTHIYQCSNCYKEVADDYIHCHKYCLHCGAKMDLLTHCSNVECEPPYGDKSDCELYKDGYCTAKNNCESAKIDKDDWLNTKMTESIEV